MSPCRTSTLLEYSLLIQLTIMSMMIMSSITHNSDGGILFVVAQQQAAPSPTEDRIGGVLGGGTARAQQVMQCFTGCGQEIVGCGVTCTLGSSQSIAPCFMDCGLSNFVCMNTCFQPTIPQEDASVAITGPNANLQPGPIH